VYVCLCYYVIRCRNPLHGKSVIVVCSLVPFIGGQWLSLSLKYHDDENLENFHMAECDPKHGDCVDRAIQGRQHMASALAVQNAKAAILRFITDHQQVASDFTVSAVSNQPDVEGFLTWKKPEVAEGSPGPLTGFGFVVHSLALGQGLT
jgi:hypothetical protein